MIIKNLALIGLMTLSLSANAATVSISGAIFNGEGTLSTLAPPGTAFAGELEWSGNLDAAKVTLGGFCFNTDATGDPATSVGCTAGVLVPILEAGNTVYTTGAAPGSTFEQAGTNFDGTTGLLKMTAYSPTFSLPITVSLFFIGDGTGLIFADAGALGTAGGAFNVVPIPAAAWLFGSALLGLAGIRRRKNASR